MAVIVENGEHGSSTAAPVARDVINAYFNYYPELLEVSESEVEEGSALLAPVNPSERAHESG